MVCFIVLLVYPSPENNTQEWMDDFIENNYFVKKILFLKENVWCSFDYHHILAFFCAYAKHINILNQVQVFVLIYTRCKCLYSYSPTRSITYHQSYTRGASVGTHIHLLDLYLIINHIHEVQVLVLILTY